MAEETYGDWIRSNPPLPTKEYKTKHMAEQTKQMTAVEWLIEQLIEQDRQLNPNSFTIQIYFEASKNILEQAKQMEKEQIVKAYSNGSNDRLKNRINDQYYNETYKQNT